MISFRIALPIHTTDTFFKETDLHSVMTVMDHRQSRKRISLVKVQKEPVPVHNFGEVFVHLVFDKDIFLLIEGFCPCKNHGQALAVDEIHGPANIAGINEIIIPVQMEGVVPGGIIIKGSMAIFYHANICLITEIFKSGVVKLIDHLLNVIR